MAVSNRYMIFFLLFVIGVDEETVTNAQHIDNKDVRRRFCAILRLEKGLPNKELPPKPQTARKYWNKINCMVSKKRKPSITMQMEI